MSEYEIPIDEAAQTVAKVLELTRQDRLAWETTADSQTLIAPFKGDYVFRLSQIDDPSDPYPTVDYVVSVTKRGRTLMSFQPYIFNKTTHIQRALGEPTEKTNPHKYFAELWKRAFFKANHVPEEFQNVNRLLDSELATSHSR